MTSDDIRQVNRGDLTREMAEVAIGPAIRRPGWWVRVANHWIPEIRLWSAHSRPPEQVTVILGLPEADLKVGLTMGADDWNLAKVEASRRHQFHPSPRRVFLARTHIEQLQADLANERGIGPIRSGPVVARVMVALYQLGGLHPGERASLDATESPPDFDTKVIAALWPGVSTISGWGPKASKWILEAQSRLTTMAVSSCGVLVGAAESIAIAKAAVLGRWSLGDLVVPCKRAMTEDQRKNAEWSLAVLSRAGDHLFGQFEGPVLTEDPGDSGRFLWFHQEEMVVRDAITDELYRMDEDERNW